MKTITIHMTWVNSVVVEVEDDFDISHPPEDVFEQMDSNGVELCDWGLTPSQIVQE